MDMQNNKLKLIWLPYFGIGQLSVPTKGRGYFIARDRAEPIPFQIDAIECYDGTYWVGIESSELSDKMLECDPLIPYIFFCIDRGHYRLGFDI